MINHKSPPADQPHPYPRMKMHKTNQGELPELIYPHEIVHIKNKKELEQALEFYCVPIPTMENHPHPKNPHALRYMLEWIFPTLRWYCQVFKVDVPSWLRGNGWADGLTPADAKKYLGDTKPLKAQEWKEDTRWRAVAA